MTDDAEAAERRTILTFRLEGEIFGLDVDHVQEIIDPLPMVRVPLAGVEAPGLMNVRGSIVPLLALRRRLGKGDAARTDDSRLIVLDVPVGGEPTRIAIEADAVEQVIELGPGSFEPVPELGIDYPPQYLEAVARIDGELVILLKTETVFEHAPRQQTAA